jgi:adenylylsulfate kinase-like enzyme
VLVYVATSLEECERRDPKGLYRKAHAGMLHGFTGIDDPYEEPEDPELRIDTEGRMPEESAEIVLETLERLGLVPAEVIS